MASSVEVTTLANERVITKYREASVVAQQALDGVLTMLLPGKRPAEVCAVGDALIEKLVAPLYSKKSLQKGIAFPTCVSVGSIVSHYSPLDSEDQVVLKDGDVVRIDLGVHIDGFIAVVAHTVVVGASAEKPITGRLADVLTAAHHAAELAVQMVTTGATNHEVTTAIGRVADAYNVTPVVGVLSHELQQFVIAGNNVIIQKEEPEAKVDTVTFQPHSAYAIDIVFSTGDGKPKESEFRTTVYKRVPDSAYGLKLKASRSLLTEATKLAPTLPFSLRALVPVMEKGETSVRMGIQEPVQHGMFDAYPVLLEREGADVAQFKFTALMLPGGTMQATGKSLPEYIKSDKRLPDDLATILAEKTLAEQQKASKKAKKGGKSAEAMDVEA